MPEANEMVVQMMAVVAQAERKLISARTKAALQAAKARGVKLGNPANLRNAATGSAKGLAVRQASASCRAADLAPVLADLRASGASSLREIAAGLNKRGIPTARGGQWSAVQVQRVMNRAGAM
jgi:DNA invertase Pin-like site-specific DNA recombinase